MTTEPASYELFRSARRSAVHLEMRDMYTPEDPDYRDWREGRRFNPAERWADWFNLISATVARGVIVRRARVISEPVTDFIRFEYEVTKDHNIAAGEQVRWLPRQHATDLALPGNDFWVFDSEVLIINHFAGDGSWVGEERCDDPVTAKLCAYAFEQVWKRATPHEHYRSP